MDLDLRNTSSSSFGGLGPADLFQFQNLSENYEHMNPTESW
jgi:hypothetical protein